MLIRLIFSDEQHEKYFRDSLIVNACHFAPYEMEHVPHFFIVHEPTGLYLVDYVEYG